MYGYLQINYWKKMTKDRLATIGSTRWWSKEKALDRIFGDNGALYIDLIIALNNIELQDILILISK
jgi:hypothetical protein